MSSERIWPLSGWARLGKGCSKVLEATAILKHKRVLVVEDEVLVAMGLIGFFEDFGINAIGPASSLTEAYRYLDQEQSIDAAILDVNLDGVEVFPFADRLRDAAIPFVFHTGHETEESLMQRYPRTRTYLKPSLPEDILKGLAEQLALT